MGARYNATCASGSAVIGIRVMLAGPSGPASSCCRTGRTADPSRRTQRRGWLTSFTSCLGCAMRFVAYLTLLLVSPAAYAQAPIQRVTTTCALDRETLLRTTPVTDTSYSEGDVGALFQHGFDSVQTIDRAELLSVLVSHEIWVQGFGVWRNAGLESARVEVDWDESTGAASPFSNNWGPFDPGGGAGTAWSTSVAPGGMIAQTFRSGALTIGSELHTPQSSFWMYVIGEPELRVYCSMNNIRWRGAALPLGSSSGAPSGGPVELERLSLLVDAYARVEFETTVELAAFPAVSLCTSPVNSTGVTASLQGYGSTQAGEDWLTIRSEGMPEGQLALLFVGTETGFDPRVTYNLCLGGSVSRVGDIKVSANGYADFELDLAGMAPGDAVHAQVLHRDPFFGTCASNSISFLAE